MDELLGRGPECEALDRLLADARAGRSGVLVLCGEPGIGKSALLEYAAGRAAGCDLTRAAGAEAEAEIAYAGLHQLCAPLLRHLDRLPPPQRTALDVALGRGDGPAPDAFRVGLAVLGLLAEAAAGRPLICLVDDAQWLDAMSAVILAFVARRLDAESVALVIATHPGPSRLDGLPSRLVTGLPDADASALLDTVLREPLDARVRHRMLAEARGNPLALLELPRGRSTADLTFGAAGAAHAGLIERGFAARLAALPGPTRLLLLTAALEPLGDVPLLWRAAARLGLDPAAVAPAEAARLIEIGARVRFRHPLVRSAAARDADPAQVRSVHRALAEATDPAADPDRRARHRAHATLGPDEPVAAELAARADIALARGGRVAAAAFLARAAELTPDPSLRAARALSAAEARLNAGQPAADLLAAADLGPPDPLRRARTERLRARAAFARERGADALPSLLAAARRLAPLDVAAARETYLDAFAAAVSAGRLWDDSPASIAAAVPPGAGLLDGLAERFTAGYAAAVDPLRTALTGEGIGPDPARLWLAAAVAVEVWDDAAWHHLAEAAVRHARSTGALVLLPEALAHRAEAHVLAGELASAGRLLAEADAIGEASGHRPPRAAAVLLAAYRGRAPESGETIDAAAKDATARGEGRLLAAAEHARAVLHAGLGAYPAALAAARRAAAHDDLGLHNWALTELVEAATRAEDPAAAADALARLESRTRAAGTDWALGIAARSRALCSPAPEPLYREALARLAGPRLALPLARTRLLYGEWLRREHRRVDARDQLRAAHEAFTTAGAEAFAERARRELAATGETARRRVPETRDELTPQEAQIARLAAAGHTNPEIGAELFLSARTVEWHLRKVFGKLGVTSRRELRTHPGLA